MRKAITALAATALVFGVTAASAQTSSGEGKPRVSKQQYMKSPGAHHNSSGVTGRTEGSNPNPSWNKNPDPEVPGNTER